jgi:hypothetical protein
MSRAKASASKASGGDTPLQLPDIQGLVLRGYRYYSIRHFIFKISDVAGARALLGLLLPGGEGALTITTAEPWNDPPPYCLNVGVTNKGLLALIGQGGYDAVSDATPTLFPPFDAGAAASAAIVGDTGTSDPSHWWPEANCRLPSPLGEDDLHLLVSLYTKSPGDRDSWSDALLAMIPAGAGGGPAIVQAFVQDADPLPTPPDAFHSGIQIHFGYADGFSQPRIQGTPWDDPGDPDDDSPMVPSWHFAIAEKAPLYNAHKLLKNGSFGAFRLLEQDVAGFDAFIHTPDSSGGAADPALVAAKMCGRWLDGTPLEVSPDGPDPRLAQNDLINFNYLTPTAHQLGPRQSDDSGLYCPYAAHTRRSNPRDDVQVFGNTLPDNSPAYAVQHRVRRFATPYGPPYLRTAPNTEPRGLVGLFMGANLTDQFEFIMQSWIGAPGFRSPDDTDNMSGVDPLFGPQQDDSNPGDQYFEYLASDGDYVTVAPMSRFIVTRGALYVFLPGIAGLSALASGTMPG